MVNVVGKIEFFAVDILDVANQVDRIEVSGLGHQALRFVAELRTFENLWRIRAVGVESDEWATAGFAVVLHHTTHADRAVKLVAQVYCQLTVIKELRLRISDAEFVVNKVDYFAKVFDGVVARIDESKVFCNCFLQKDKVSADYLLETDGYIAFRHWNHIVDVLDENHVGIALVEILNKSTMAGRTEQQRAVGVAEWSVVLVDGNCVG